MSRTNVFGKSILFTHIPSFLERIRFFLLGQDFIGAEIRFSYFKKIINTIPSITTALDAGCGTGDFSYYLAQQYPSLTISAYDINANTIQKNKQIQKKMEVSTIQFKQKNLLYLNKHERYDFIYCIGTLIYFSKKDSNQILRNLTAALKRGGNLYLDLPQKDFSEVAFFPQTWYKKHYNLLCSENKGDLYFFTEILEILQQLDYEIIYSTKSFSYFGKFAWEFDNILREKNVGRFRYMFVPFLKLCARLDVITKHKKGSCFVVLARKK